MDTEKEPVEKTGAPAPGVDPDADEREFDNLLRKSSKKSRDGEKMEKVRDAKATKPKAEEPAEEADPAKLIPGIDPAPQEEEPEPAEEEKQKKTKLADDAARFAALSRREKQALEVERRAKQEREHVDSKLKEIERYASQLKTERDELASIRKDPVKLLAWGGHSLDDTIGYVLNDLKPTPDMATREVESRVMAELRDIKERLAAKEKDEETRRERAQADEETRAVQQFQRDIDKYLRTNAEEYDLINTEDAHDQVFELIRLQYEADGTLLEIDDAAKKVEAALEERGRKLLSSKKLGGYLASQTAPSAQDKQAHRTRERSASPKQITNSLVSSPGSGDDDLLSMSEDDAFDVLVSRTKARRSRRT